MKKFYNFLHISALCFVFCLITFGCASNQNDKQQGIVVQNNTGNILDGETIYPEQVKAVIKHYNEKYKINISYVNGDDGLDGFLSNLQLSKKPQGVFQYNKGHKYGFIFVKYNNIDYCVIIDTIPHLSSYKNKLSVDNNKLYIKFDNGKKYRAIMFGENLQKANQGCGSFTLAILKQLLKFNALPLYEVIRMDAKYGTGDKLNRDKDKKSILRGTDFNIVKSSYFAPHIYKYAQTMSLQKEFDNVYFKNKKIMFNTYRNFYSTKYKDKQVSTKVFEITQKYKDMANQNDEHISNFKNVLFTFPKNEEEDLSIKGLQTYKRYFNTAEYYKKKDIGTLIETNIIIENNDVVNNDIQTSVE